MASIKLAVGKDQDEKGTTYSRRVPHRFEIYGHTIAEAESDGQGRIRVNGFEKKRWYAIIQLPNENAVDQLKELKKMIAAAEGR